MDKFKRVAVNGATGKVGREIVKAVMADPEIELVAAIDVQHPGIPVGKVLGLEKPGPVISQDLALSLEESGAGIMVDFTTPQTVRHSVPAAIKRGVFPIVGTTGIGLEELQQWEELCRIHRTGALVVPNFALGAVLMMLFAQQAARYFPQVEIIELHHDQKLDAPSGTALKTSQMIAEQRKPDIKPRHGPLTLKIEGVRGGEADGIPIHSVRLPGLVAHQEVIFGGQGQTLTIRHDSVSRESYVPGVMLAIRRAPDLDGLVYGLENILEE